MRQPAIRTTGTVVLGFCLLWALGVATVHADVIFGEPINLGPNVNGSTFEASTSMTADGLVLFLDGIRPGGQGNMDIWMITRDTVESEWSAPVNAGYPLNTSAWDGVPSISADGLTLFFASTRSGDMDLFTTTRRTRDDSWATPVNLGAPLNPPSTEWSPWVSADQLEVYFASDQPGGYGGLDLWRSTRSTVNDTWGQPVNLGPTINSSSDDMIPNVTADGLCMFFGSTRPGGYGNRDTWMTTRATRNDDWRTPMNPGPPLNGPYMDGTPFFSPDGSTLHFWSTRPGGYGSADLWRVSIELIVDFNADDKVDAADMSLLIDNWGTDNTLYDIGPSAWGDGIVDAQDLAVLGEYMDVRGPVVMHSPGANAGEVSPGVVLVWTPGDFAQTHDVYLGTSLEAVADANRILPLDVLVSQSQEPNTYDPPDLLEYGRTYYWRVDEVGAAPDFIIYHGPVVSFTTEAFAYPIENIDAIASSHDRGMGSEKTIDGSGLDENDGHSMDGKQMWLSGATPPHWIQYEFDQVYALHELWVWNSNQLVEPFMGFGAKTVKIEYSTDGETWTLLEDVPEFARAPGTAGYTANTIVSFGGVSAKYVKLTIEKGWGMAPNVGLSEVRFFYIPDRSAYNP